MIVKNPSGTTEGVQHQEPSLLTGVSDTSKPLVQSQSQDGMGQKPNGALSESDEAREKITPSKTRGDITGDTSPEPEMDKHSVDHHSVRKMLGKSHEGHHGNTKLDVSKDHHHSVREDTGLEAHHDDTGKNKVHISQQQ